MNKKLKWKFWNSFGTLLFFPIVVFGAAAINTNTSSGFAFPAEKSSAFGDEKIEIPQSVFTSTSSGQCDEVYILDSNGKLS